MSRLNYPSDGIYKYCTNNIDLITSNLRNATNNCSFDIPSGFAYTNYLYGLSSQINNYISNINSIDSKLQTTNSNFENLEDELSTSTKKLTSIKVTERDRMIY